MCVKQILGLSGALLCRHHKWRDQSSGWAAQTPWRWSWVLQGEDLLESSSCSALLQLSLSFPSADSVFRECLLNGFCVDCSLLSPDWCFFLQIPALGKHYSQRWAQEDLLEEQREGARANDKKKSIMGPLSELDAKGIRVIKDVSWFPLHFLHLFLLSSTILDCVDVDALLKKSETQHEPPDDGCPFGPLTQRLLQALVEVSDSSFAKISHYIVQHLVSFITAQFISLVYFSHILFMHVGKHHISYGGFPYSRHSREGWWGRYVTS